MVDLKVSFCGCQFENPFVLAPSPCTDDLEKVRRAFRSGWAGAVLKTTSVEGTLVNLAYPMLTGLKYEGKRIGMGNIDLISIHHLDEVESRVKILKKEFPGKIVIASMMGATREDWITLANRLHKAGVDLIECSFSCPQGTLGSKPGFMLGQDKELVQMVTNWVKEGAETTPVVIKITPQVTEIVEIARAIEKGGGDGICASNTIPSLMGIDLDTFIPYPNVGGKFTYSGLSGPAIKPITLRVIAEIARNVSLPISGTGGAFDWRDTVEFLLVGATVVQFCTGVMHYGFRIIDNLVDGLKNYLKAKGFSSPQELVGKSLHFLVTHEGLPRGFRVKSRIKKDLCIRDDLCYIACQDGGHLAISLRKNRFPIVDEEKCVGCGLCKVVCPVEGCISLEQVSL